MLEFHSRYIVAEKYSFPSVKGIPLLARASRRPSVTVSSCTFVVNRLLPRVGHLPRVPRRVRSQAGNPGGPSKIEIVGPFNVTWFATRHWDSIRLFKRDCQTSIHFVIVIFRALDITNTPSAGSVRFTRMEY